MKYLGYALCGGTVGYIGSDAYGAFSGPWLLVTAIVCIGCALIEVGTMDDF